MEAGTYFAIPAAPATAVKKGSQERSDDKVLGWLLDVVCSEFRYETLSWDSILCGNWKYSQSCADANDDSNYSVTIIERNSFAWSLQLILLLCSFANDCWYRTIGCCVEPRKEGKKSSYILPGTMQVTIYNHPKRTLYLVGRFKIFYTSSDALCSSNTNSTRSFTLRSNRTNPLNFRFLVSSLMLPYAVCRCLSFASLQYQQSKDRYETYFRDLIEKCWAWPPIVRHITCTQTVTTMGITFPSLERKMNWRCSCGFCRPK